MSNSYEKVVLDSKYTNIIDTYSNDEVILVGVYSDSTNSYFNNFNNIELVLNREVGYPICIDLPYNGYHMQIFTGNFLGNDKREIMIRGSFDLDSENDFAIIYKYENENLVEIFNQGNDKSCLSLKDIKNDNFILKENSTKISPMKKVSNNYYELLIEQQILDKSLDKTVGRLQFTCDLLNEEFKISSKYLCLPL